MTRDYPTASTLTVVRGEMVADEVRFESLESSSDLYLPQETLLNVFPALVQKNDDRLSFRNFHGFMLDGKTWEISIHQKKSYHGWLTTEPSCYYFWKMSKLQEFSRNPDGGSSWKPGTEKGILFRRPLGWRRDIAGTVRDGLLRHWIWTYGHLGSHYD